MQLRPPKYVWETDPLINRQFSRFTKTVIDPDGLRVGTPRLAGGLLQW